MTAKRSLNKLEWKAHMSIHNTVEIQEGELHPDACFTRDRFGKKQEINKSRPFFNRSKTKTAAVLFLLMLLSGNVFAGGSRNTNVQVESESLKDLDFLNDKKKSEERLTFYKDDKAAIDINSDGEPNLNMRF